MVSMGTHDDAACFFDTQGQGFLTRHTYNSIQIDDFLTRAPSPSPSKTPSGAPTAQTTPPTTDPTDGPTTASPTSDPTDAPTEAPSGSPTAKPTDLPTVNRTLLDYPPCPGMIIRHLDTLFPTTQAMEEFNEVIGDVYNRRRVWTNGRLSVHFSTRFGDGGDWVITNGSYSAISLSDANFNNSEVYNTSNLYDNPNSLPGPYPEDYIYYDHFSHDNIFSKPDKHKTLYFSCINTSHPTSDPTPAPVTSQPSRNPTTGTPTMAPTQNCTGLSICPGCIISDDCGGDIIDLFKGDYLKQHDSHGKAKWHGVASVTGYVLYYNIIQENWVIRGEDGYSMVTDGTQRYPPMQTEWSVSETDDPFNIPCIIEFRYECSGTGIPTRAPTQSPLTSAPTTAEPSKSPTDAPSLAPTLAPSTAPSIAPTAAPTGSPISECLGFEVKNSEYMNGLYGRTGSVDLETGRYRWNQIKGDGEIFWSDSPLHESWIIYSNNVQKYWLSKTHPNYQPHLANDWYLYSGASPFIIDTRELELVCFKTLPPTADPTAAPSIAPSDAPSFSPSKTPSQPPSRAPTPAPTDVPTPSPTTLDPTSDPTQEPTFQPTYNPTAEPCAYLLITNTLDVAAMDLYVGVYAFLNDSSPGLSWIRNVSETCNGCQWILSHNSSKNSWEISNTVPATNGLILSIAGSGGIRPPYNGINWRISTDTSNIDYAIDIDCSRTDAPTNAPTMAPSLAPSMSPTSSCMGLYFNNTERVDWEYNGWYARQNDYYINGHRYWVGVDLTATIAYIHGHWYLSEKDNDIIDDEDPLMLTTDGWDLLSPPSGMWLYADASVDDSENSDAYVSITCRGTRYPSMNPTEKPSESPTEYIPLTWKFCPDFRPHFAFISSNNSAVYWPMPVLNDHLYDINVSVSEEMMVPGMSIIVPGAYMVNYTATDASPSAMSIMCSVIIYVIGGGKYSTEYEYCKRANFVIELEFNDTFYRLGADKEEQTADEDESVSSGPLLEGIVYDPMLEKEGQNCYVYARQITKYGTVEVVEEADKSTFLGMEAVNVVWEVLVLLLIIILFCLIADCLYRIYKDRKNKQRASDEEQTQQLLDSASPNVDVDEQEQGKDINMDDEKEPEDNATGADIEMQPQPVTFDT